MRQQVAIPNIDEPPRELAGALALLQRAAAPTEQDLSDMRRKARQLWASSLASATGVVGDAAEPSEPTPMAPASSPQRANEPGAGSNRLARFGSLRSKLWLGAGALAMFGAGRWSVQEPPPAVPAWVAPAPLQLAVPELDVVGLASDLPLPAQSTPVVSHEVAGSPTTSPALPSPRRRGPSSRPSAGSLLQQAEAALRREEPGRALSLLKSVPLGPRTQQSVDFLRLIAHCKLKRNVVGLRSKFLATWKRGPYEARLKSECPE